MSKLFCWRVREPEYLLDLTVIIRGYEVRESIRAWCVLADYLYCCLRVFTAATSLASCVCEVSITSSTTKVMLSLLLRTPTSSRHILCSAYRRTFHWKHARQQEESQTYRARKTSSLNPTLLILGFVPVFTFALGTWQIQRLKWKVNLIDELQEKLQRAPMLLPGRIECGRSMCLSSSTAN